MKYKINIFNLKDYVIRNNNDGSQTGCTEGTNEYQQFIQDVAEQGLEIVEGPDIVEPDYIYSSPTRIPIP
jgi:hypothetical protein